MITYPIVDPVAISIGPLKIHWYGLMYLMAFGLVWWLGRRRAQLPESGWSNEQIGDLVFYGSLGAVLGGRIGYTLFYGFDRFLADPLYLFRIWEGGMSFHGGFLGVVVALWLFGRKTRKRFWEVADFVAPLVPLGLGAGRFGNFINGELWGRPTGLPWGIVFPGGGDVTRHPSQMYELALEGLLLFAILWWYSARPRAAGAVSGLFLLGYGSARFLVEFVREPDAHIGPIAGGWVTMGQVLSLPMILAGAVVLIWAFRRPSDPSASAGSAA